MKKASEMTVEERLKAPTPKFFRKVGLAGKILLAVAGVAATVGATLVAGPAGGVAAGKLLLTISGVIGGIGTGAASVAAATVDEHAQDPNLITK